MLCVGQMLNKKGTNTFQALDLATIPLWDPFRGVSKRLRLIDGGTIDNLGILALARRGVKRIISCISRGESFFVDDLTEIKHGLFDLIR